MLPLYDIIAAISTPLGKGGVSVIRISGDGALALTEKVFKPMSGKSFFDYPARIQVYGNILKDGYILDDVLAVYYNKGASYTGEQTVEISCHGGVLVTRELLELLIRAGARAAEPGEFTRRAFINGRLSLTEAEAIGMLLDAKSTEQIRLAGSEARARLDDKIASIKSELISLLSSSYARIDYPDEDLGDFSDGEYLERLQVAYESLCTLIATYRTGKAISEGIKTVICGKPNVGKSTLYNLLAGEELAIVTDISGTTRDVLEHSIPLGRVMLNIADTAGIRRGELDTVEKIGIERSKKRISEAELIFAVFDLSDPLDEYDKDIINEVKRASGAKIAMLNKCDKGAPMLDVSKLDSAFDAIITISARCGESEAITALTEKVEALFTDEKINTGYNAIVSTARQNASLNSTKEFLISAIDAMKAGMTQDAVSSDIERALAVLGEVDGRAVSEDVISDIFSKFCVGK